MIRRFLIWLTSFFWSSDEDRYDTYKLSERLIYRYHNGEKEVRADPMFLYKKIMARGPELAIDIKVSESLSKDAGTAHNNLIKTVRDIFDLKPFEQGGLTEIEVARLLDHFLIYVESVKKKGSPTVISPTATSANLEFSSIAVPPSENTSANGSIADVPSIADPIPSLSESVSPSA